MNCAEKKVNASRHLHIAASVIFILSNQKSYKIFIEFEAGFNANY